MKAMQLVVFFFLFNAFLFIFTSVGVYQIEGNYKPKQGWEAGREGGAGFLQNILQISGVGFATASIAGVAAYFLAGVTGLQAISISVLLGIFTSFFYNTYTVLTGIIEAIPYGSVIQVLLVLTGSMFAIMILYAVVQMGIGGGRSYE